MKDVPVYVSKVKGGTVRSSGLSQVHKDQTVHCSGADHLRTFRLIGVHFEFFFFFFSLPPGAEEENMAAKFTRPPTVHSVL